MNYVLKTFGEKKGSGQHSPSFSLFSLSLSLSLSHTRAYRNFKLRHFATRFITSINYFRRKGWQGEFQTSGFLYVRRKVRRVQLSRISRFHPIFTYAPLLFFRSLISFVPPVPTPPSCLLSLVFCHSLVTDQRFSCSSLGAKQFIPFLLYFLFHHHPDLRFPFSHILISSLSLSFFFVRDENTRFVNIRFARLFRYF